MGYTEMTSWMFNLERFGIKLGLDNVREFLERVGNPQREFKSIHVTGTNGKGSVCAFADQVLRKAGYKVGLYTSPHLVDFRERIRVNGAEISEKDVVRLGEELRETMELMASEDREKQLTFFEFTTGLAFEYFKEKCVDIAVIEVGMGGRLDATNLILPEVSVITRIGLEHTNYLGKTIPEIAREKAGIIKQGVPVVTCERKPEALSVIMSACERKGASLARIGKDFDVSNLSVSLDGTAFDYSGQTKLSKIRIGLLGAHQAENAAAAVAAIEALRNKGFKITDDNIRKGAETTKWPGRLDVVSRKPLLIFDGSHNPDGALATASVLEKLEATPLTYVLACMDDKDARGIVKAIAPTAARIVVTQTAYKRALNADLLAGIVREEFQGPQTKVVPSSEALTDAFMNPLGKGACAIGSLYLVGEAIQWWNRRR